MSRLTVNLAALFLLLLGLAGCGQPYVRSGGASYTDPAFYNRHFPALIVQADAGSLQERQLIERSVSAALNLAGVAAQESAHLLPPTRDYSKQAALAVLGKSGLPGVLVIRPMQRALIHDYVPPVYYPGRFGYSGSRINPVIEYEQGYYQGGYYIDRPRTNYEAVIFALPGREKAWTAELRLEGSGGTDYGFLDASLDQVLVDRLRADGLIAPVDPALTAP